MSFWEGFARAYESADIKKTKAQERAEDRADRDRLRQEDKEWQLKMFGMQQDATTQRELRALKARRTEALMPYLTAGGSTSGGGGSTGGGAGGKSSNADANAVAWLKHTLGDTPGGEDLLAEAIQRPEIARQIYDIEQGNADAARKEGQRYSISPLALVENYQIFGATGLEEGRGFTYEDLQEFENGPGDDEAFISIMSKARASVQKAADVIIDNKGGPSFGNFEAQDKFFDDQVLEAATLRLDELSAGADEGNVNNEKEYARLSEHVKNYTDGGIHRKALRDTFGWAVVEGMQETGLFTNLDQNPNLATISAPETAPVVTPAGDIPTDDQINPDTTQIAPEPVSATSVPPAEEAAMAAAGLITPPSTPDVPKTPDVPVFKGPKDMFNAQRAGVVNAGDVVGLENPNTGEVQQVKLPEIDVPIFMDQITSPKGGVSADLAPSLSTPSEGKSPSVARKGDTKPNGTKGSAPSAPPKTDKTPDVPVEKWEKDINSDLDGVIKSAARLLGPKSKALKEISEAVPARRGAGKIEKSNMLRKLIRELKSLPKTAGREKVLKQVYALRDANK